MSEPWTEIAVNIPEKRKKRKKYRISCGRCGKRMHLHGCVYICSDQVCKGNHKANLDGSPTGIPANVETAKSRLHAHRVFDRLWKSGKVSRSQAYIILKRIMGFTIQEAHIGRFTIDQCNFLIKNLNELGDKVFEPPYNVQGFSENDSKEN